MGKSAYPYLVTGATGFIGGRVVEKLCLEGWGVPKALVHTPRNAINIARFPVQMIQGSMTDDKAIAQAVEGVDTVFHCAHLFDGDTADNQIAMRTLLKAADKQGVRRVIVLSTADVYQPGQSRYVTEATPYKPYGSSAYIDAKKGIEQVCRNYEGARPEVVVIQPTIVYGPWGKAWTERIFDLMLRKRMPLINDGKGLCNLVYIDDLVDLLLKAVDKPGLDSETFIANNPDPITWRTFYGYFEDIIGKKRTASVPIHSLASGPQQKALGMQKALSKLKDWVSPWLSRSLKERIKHLQKQWENPDKVHAVTPEQVAYYKSEHFFYSGKAFSKLEWEPLHPVKKGFEEVQAWYGAYYLPRLKP